jgi:hypothetical protein
MVGGTGPQSFTSTASVPAVNDFALTDAFTTFAIGFSGGLDSGSTMDISNLTVTAVPEPATYALLSGLFTLGLILVRRRRRVAFE